MNQPSSTETSASSNVAPDAISRRAYELWEAEGRPEGCDMRHWLQAEQELGVTRSTKNNLAGNTAQVPAPNSDVTPLQGTRAAAAVNASRENSGAKRTTSSALPVTEKNGNGAQNGTKRKATASAM